MSRGLGRGMNKRGERWSEHRSTQFPVRLCSAGLTNGPSAPQSSDSLTVLSGSSRQFLTAESGYMVIVCADFITRHLMGQRSTHNHISSQKLGLERCATMSELERTETWKGSTTLTDNSRKLFC